jgi:hypothetical protein
MWWPIESLVSILNQQSNAPHILVNGQGQGHMNTQTTTTNQDMVFNLQTILNDIQSRLTKLNLLDSMSMFAFVVLVAFACLSLLETHL